MIHHLRIYAEELHDNLCPQRYPDDVCTSTMRPLGDELRDASRSIHYGERASIRTQAMFGQVGDKTMIVVLEHFDLWAPHPPADPSTMQKADRRRCRWSTFACTQASNRRHW